MSTDPAALLTLRVFSVLAPGCVVGALAIGCLGPTESRSEEEICMWPANALPDGPCNTAADAFRLDRFRFRGCADGERNCRIENLRGPHGPPHETAGGTCCYTYTVVRIDDSLVD